MTAKQVSFSDILPRMKTETIVLQLTFILNAFGAVAGSAPSNSWDGCVNKCETNPELFCEQDFDVCMGCNSICDDASYTSRCTELCPAYLALPKVQNNWDGCEESCQFDIGYFCEAFTKTCMECEYICDSTGEYYNKDQCYSNCAGYMQFFHTTPKLTTSIQREPTTTSTPTDISQPTPKSLSTRQNTNVDTGNVDSLSLIAVLGIIVPSICLCIVIIVTVIIKTPVVHWFKRSGNRNLQAGDEENARNPQQQNPERRTEARLLLNGQAVEARLINDVNDHSTLPYPHKETQGPSTEVDVMMKESGLNEVGGAFRTDHTLLLKDVHSCSSCCF